MNISFPKACFMKTGFFAIAVLLLAACSPSLKHQITQQDKSVILMGVETIPDFRVGFLSSDPRRIYGFTPNILGGEQKKSDPVSNVFYGSQDNLRWVALAVDPGTYVLGRIIERGNNGDLFDPIDTKVTNFRTGPERLTFTVGENETVYIGTVSSSFTTVDRPLLTRYLGDAKKSYRLDDALARAIVAKRSIPTANFRSVDVFANRPAARQKFEKPWSARPNNY